MTTLSERKINELKERFGVDEFRTGQIECVQDLISGLDTFVSLPCGSGKSLIFADEKETKHIRRYAGYTCEM